MRLRRAIFVLPLFVMGCTAEGSTLAVELRTDLVAGAEFAEVVTTLDSLTFAPHAADATLDYVRGVRIGELGGLAHGRHLLTTTLTTPDGTVVVRRRIRLDISQNRGVTVIVTRDCRGVSCPTAAEPSAEACLAGRCVDDRCTPEDDSACPAPECLADSDCTSGAACAVGRCDSGVCLFEGDGSCGALAYCDPDSGCRMLPGAMPDAGVDAGTPVCVNGACEGEAGESCLSCTADCDTRDDVCGNGECSATESSATCMTDCGPDPWPTEWTTFAMEYFDEINARRATGTTCPSGFQPAVGPVTINAGLQRAAELHAWERAESPIIALPDGESCNGRTILDRATAQGVSGAAGQFTTFPFGNTATAAVDSWETSDLCEALLMNAAITEVGPGVAVRNGGVWTVMLR